MADEKKPEQDTGIFAKWIGVMRATGSPLKMFALIVLICNSVFGVAAAWSYGPEIFIYTLHTFLAVVAAFVMIVLWSPRSFYSPTELIALVELEQRTGRENTVFPVANPKIATLVIAAFVLAYGIYQLIDTAVKCNNGVSC